MFCPVANQRHIAERAFRLGIALQDTPDHSLATQLACQAINKCGDLG